MIRSTDTDIAAVAATFIPIPITSHSLLIVVVNHYWYLEEALIHWNTVCICMLSRLAPGKRMWQHGRVDCDCTHKRKWHDSNRCRQFPFMYQCGWNRREFPERPWVGHVCRMALSPSFDSRQQIDTTTRIHNSGIKRKRVTRRASWFGMLCTFTSEFLP